MPEYVKQSTDKNHDWVIPDILLGNTVKDVKSMLLKEF